MAREEAFARRHYPVWYKNAVIYQVHVRTFYDSNGDGVGDFEGLAQKLDYLRDLGVNAIWRCRFSPRLFETMATILQTIRRFTRFTEAWSDRKIPERRP